AQAKEYLERAAPNRPVGRVTVEQYARDMKAGRWSFTGEPLIFDDDGRMLNGQHRCHAIVLAQVPISTLVVRGVDRRSMPNMDGGRKRQVADVLGMEGQRNATVVAGAARLVWCWAAGVSMKYQPTRAAQIEFARRHIEALDRAAALIVNYRK